MVSVRLKSMTMTWQGHGAKAGLQLAANARGQRVECMPLPSMLQSAADSGEQLIGGHSGQPIEVTFWSLDVEGAELMVLNATLGSPLLRVRVLLIESAAHPTTLEPFMNAFGFVKVRKPRRISADHVYVNSADVDELMPVELWDPQ